MWSWNGLKCIVSSKCAAETDSNTQRQANVINTNSLHYVCPLQPLSALRVPLNHNCWGCFSSGRFSSSPSLLARDLDLPLRSWFCRMERGASHGSWLRDPRPVVSTQAGLLCVEGHPDGNRMTGVVANIVTVVTTWDLQYKWLTAHGTEPAKAMTWKSKSETLVFTDQGFTYATYSSTCERHVLFYNMYVPDRVDFLFRGHNLYCCYRCCVPLPLWRWCLPLHCGHYHCETLSLLLGSRHRHPSWRPSSCSLQTGPSLPSSVEHQLVLHLTTFASKVKRVLLHVFTHNLGGYDSRLCMCSGYMHIRTYVNETCYKLRTTKQLQFRCNACMCIEWVCKLVQLNTTFRNDGTSKVS